MEPGPQPGDWVLRDWCETWSYAVTEAVSGIPCDTVIRPELGMRSTQPRTLWKRANVVGVEPRNPIRERSRGARERRRHHEAPGRPLHGSLHHPHSARTEMDIHLWPEAKEMPSGRSVGC